MPDESVDMCLTSPPYYGLRDYGVEAQIGREESPAAYVSALQEVFAQVHRVLKPEGTFWLNIADTYCGTGSKGSYVDPKYPNGRTGQSVSLNQTVQGCKSKDLVGIPWMLAFALRDAGWYLRQDIIWHKPNAMPESVKDRCTKSYEHIFLLSKSPHYYFDYEAIREPCSKGSVKDFKRRKTLDNKSHGEGSYEGVRPDLSRSRSDYYPQDFMRRARDVWSINTKAYRGEHFAAFPLELASRCILAGCPEGGIVLDPFMGSGTTALAAERLHRHYTGSENPDYVILAEKRLEDCI